MSPRRRLFRAALVFLSGLFILNNVVVVRGLFDRPPPLPWQHLVGVVLPTNRSGGSTGLGGDVARSNSLNYCVRNNLVFSAGTELGGASAHESQEEGMTMLPVDYQCTGESYENYTSHYLKPYAEKVARNSSWGRRSFPLPDHVSVLVLGNSHTKQTVLSLLCQHADAVRSVTPLGPSDIHPPNMAYFFEARFLNGASMVFLGNHPLLYSRSWAEHVRRFDPRHRTLSDYDAVVLGQFNRYDPKFRNSLIFSMLLSFQNRHPGLIDVEHDVCPSLIDVADRYNKSIVVLPMFASFARAWTKQVVEIAQGLRRSQNRSNIGVIQTRGHIHAMGIECGSRADRTSIGTCIDNGGAHRCSGPSGGDADLMAWDLIESLYGAIR